MISPIGKFCVCIERRERRSGSVGGTPIKCWDSSWLFHTVKCFNLLQKMYIVYIIKI